MSDNERDPALPAAALGAARPRPGDWRELITYLLAGYGLFALGSLVLVQFFDRVSIAASVAVYALNALCFAGAAYWFGVRRPGLTWAEFGLRPFNRRWLLVALGVAAAVIPLRAAAALLVEALLGSGLDSMQARLDIVAPAGPLGVNFVLTLLGAGLLAPFSEEVYFRGLLHRWFQAHFSFWPGVLLSSILFALGHFDNAGVAASSFFLGVICAVAVERSRSLWLPIAIHAANNSLAVVLVYATLAGQGR